MARSRGSPRFRHDATEARRVDGGCAGAAAFFGLSRLRNPAWSKRTCLKPKKSQAQPTACCSRLAEATALETPDLFASVQTNLSRLGEVEDLFMAKAQELLNAH